jgi:N-acetylmuramoyl-L-alanine amidase
MHRSSPANPPPDRRAGRLAAARRKAGLAVLLGLAALLGGCAGGPAINTSHRAQGQDSRVLFLILHYTDENFANSLRILTQRQVSSHYLLSDETPPRIYRLVDEDRRAWHAGESHWKGHAMLNASSIGIEIVNLGQRAAADGTRSFTPYPPAQIDLLVALVKDIVTRHQIRPDRVLGHSDIAPQRKIDPGPAFPWKRLADEGLVAWPDAARVAALLPGHQAELPAVAWFQQELATLGFKVPTSGLLDDETRRVLAAFQMKYRPARHDGSPDAETAALLQALTAPVPR